MYWGQFEASHDLFEPCFQLMKTMVGSNLKEEQLRQVVNRTVLFVDKVTLSLFLLLKQPMIKSFLKIFRLPTIH